MQESKRRKFLKNSLKFGAVAGVGVLATQMLAEQNEPQNLQKGKSKKKEVLYSPSKSWQDYYKMAQI